MHSSPLVGRSVLEESLDVVPAKRLHSVGIDLSKTTFHLVRGINVQPIFRSANGGNQQQGTDADDSVSLEASVGNPVPN